MYRTSPRRSDPGALLIQLNELDSYADSELVRKKIASFLAGFIAKPASSDSSIIGEEVEGEASVVELAAGRINVLEEGEKIIWSAPLRTTVRGDTELGRSSWNAGISVR